MEAAAAQRTSRGSQPLTAVASFAAFYVGSLSLLVYWLNPRAPVGFQWIAVASVLFATTACILIIDNARFDLGLGGPAREALRQLAAGAALATAILLVSDALIVGTTHLRHHVGDGVPWVALGALFLPAVFHEELLFRGYAFQKIAAHSEALAVAMGSLLFAALHLGNHSVGPVALANIVLAGVLLSLAYLLWQSLWFPIATHFWWNIFSGPVLGHEVSGFVIRPTLLTTVDPGPALLTGGAFGIEASLWTTLAEAGGIAFLLWRMRGRRARLSTASASSES
jgi:membrane protease YdiL (CAAX protease family)